MYWERLSREEIRRRVAIAIDGNVNYHTDAVLGFPGTHLDAEDYYADGCSVLTRIPWASPLLDDEPFLRTIIENPNHIGCHTAAESEVGFPGTQALEREALAICAEEIMGAPAGAYDGYISPGGTESNIQACWVLRNLLRRTHAARPGEVGLVFSSDTHYSLWKAADLLGLRPYPVPVSDTTREMGADAAHATVAAAVRDGVRCVIGVVNMGTTMFGSIDDLDVLVAAFEEHNLPFYLHVDGAFGGFIYPFVVPDHPLDFRNPLIASITMDAHKMLKAPYGTGIFLCRKGLIDEVCTTQASYVHGKDYTVCGSRSGANAVAVWMLLRDAGSEGHTDRCRRLVERTDRFCSRLDAMGVAYYRHPAMNQVAIRAEYVPPETARRFLLVPDRHDDTPRWWKIIVMDHVRDALLEYFLEEIGEQNT